MADIEENQSNNLTTQCRICARHSDNIVDLYNAEHNGLKYVDMLVFCIKQRIHENDGLPKIICQECRTDLIKVHSFHTLYSESEQHFRQLLPSTENRVKAVKVELESEPDEPCRSQIKVENESQIVVLPDINYFHSEQFETEQLQNVVLNQYTASTKKNSRKISEKVRKESVHEKKRRRLLSEGQKFEAFECYECKKKFNRFSSLQRHAGSHIKNEKLFECTECRIRFVYLKSLFRHRRQRHSDRVYECEYCTEAFESLSKLKQHVNGTHKDELKTYRCELCSKTFLLQFQLSCHQTDDSCSKSFRCTSCDETFPMHRMLKNHIRDKHTSNFVFHLTIAF